MGFPVLGLIGLLLGIAILIIFAYKGVNIYVYSIFAAIVVLLFSGMNIWEHMSTTFMTGFVAFFKGYFLLILAGALFAKIMGDSGACSVICHKLAGLARKCKTRKGQYRVAILSLAAIQAIVTAGGINVLVIIFLLVDMAKELYEELDIPWHLCYLSIFGCNTITMTMLPGMVSVPNIVPVEILGTTPMAGAVVGILASILEVVLCLILIEVVVRRNLKTEERFLPTGAAIKARASAAPKECPNYHIIYVLIPPALVIVLLNVFKLPAVLSILGGCLLAMIMFYKTFPVKKYSGCVNSCLNEAVVITGNVCAVVGFGAVVSATPAYAAVLEGLHAIPGSPMIQLIIAVNVAAGLTGSSSAGLQIALPQLAPGWLQGGMEPAVVHRLACISSGGLESLPHCASIINGFQVFGVTHKMVYKYVFIETVIFPIICAFFAAALFSLGLR